MQTVPTTHPAQSDGISPQNSANKKPFGSIPSGDIAAANEARRLQVAGWADLHLRQTFADEDWMKAQIKAAGLRSPNQMEPATVKRLRCLLKRAQVTGTETNDSLGTTLSGYLKLNPLLPLWAVLALVLEATGKFIFQVTASIDKPLMQRKKT